MSHTQQIIRVNGDVEDNIFVFGNSLATIANGGAGEDYYFYLSGQVTVSDYSSNNQLYFGPNITITAASILRSQLRIDFEGTDDTLRLSNFSSYQFFIGSDEDRDNDEDGLSHTEFLASVNSGNITVSTPSELSPTAPALERTVEIRANGTIDADTFSLGYDLRAELNGGAGRDTFVITPYQTDDVQIRDFSVGNLIRFESDVEIANFEINRGTFGISLDNGAMISVIIGSLQNYQLGEGSVIDAAEFMMSLAPTEITLENQVTTLAEDSDAIRVATINIVNADGSSNLRGGLELSGADSALFEINEARTELLLKAGSILDFETNPELTVIVSSTLNSGITGTLMISLDDANEAPTNSVTADRAFEVAEGGSYTLTTDDLSATDEDASDGAEQLTWRVSTAPTSGTLQIGGAMVDSFTQAQLVAGAVIYVHNGNEPVAESFTVQVEDDETPPLTADSQTVTVTVTPVNDAPTISNTISSRGIADDGMTTIDLADFFSDPEGDNLSYTAVSGDISVVTTMIDGSTLTLNPVVATTDTPVTITVTASDLAGLEVEQTFRVIVSSDMIVLAIQASAIQTDGFVINGVSESDQSGFSVSGAGDINGDGLDDIIIGARVVNGGRGASYLVFGNSDGGIVELDDIDDESDTRGFVLNGVDEGDLSGRSVSGAGDINGDGLDDLIIGALQANPNGSNSGASYVVFGKT